MCTASTGSPDAAGREDSADRQTCIAAIALQPDEFECFYREHLDTVRVYLARRVDDPAAIADPTADIFLRVPTGDHRSPFYREDLGPPRAWLIGIARNVVADHRRPGAHEAAALRRFGARELLDEDSTEHIVERISSQRDARELLASLPTSQREVVELGGVDQLSITGAAQVLQIKPGTARVRFHRAGRALQDKPLFACRSRATS